MSTDLEHAQEFANPVTGEVLTLAAPTPDLASYLADVRDLESRIREHKNIVQAEVLSRLDRDRNWTVHLPGLELSAPSDAPAEEFDELALREELLVYVDSNELSIEAVDRAIETVVTYKIRKAGLNALRKSPKLAEIIDRYARPVEKRRYVSVKRSGTS